MIDWLRRPSGEPVVTVGDQSLPVIITRRHNARRLTMRLARDGSHIKISAPQWCPTKEALAFAAARSDWIASRLARVPERLALGPGSTVCYRGESLRLEWRKQASRRVLRVDDALVFGGPEDAVAGRAQRWLEGEAKALMRGDLADYCGRAGLPLAELKLSRAQRRWGSCSAQKIVRINWRLIQAPDYVRRSVVAHEAAHLVHFDHSPRFHALLAEIYEGDLSAADAWLKQHGPSLYAAFG